MVDSRAQRAKRPAGWRPLPVEYKFTGLGFIVLERYFDCEHSNFIVQQSPFSMWFLSQDWLMAEIQSKTFDCEYT
jgi:hypothetical protein